MKPLKVSTATFAVAISLASAAQAQANDGSMHLALEEAEPLQELNVGTGSTPGASTFALAHDTVAVSEGSAVDAFETETREFITIPSLSGDVDVALSTESNVVALSVNANYGDIGAFYGDIGAFYGDIDAFYGDIGAFWGDINPFYGDITAFWGDINPFYGDITAFWGDIDAFWGDIVAFDEAHLQSLGNWGQQAKTQIGVVENHWSSLKYSISALGVVSITFDGTPDRIRNSLETLIAQAEAQFGAAYTAKTGKSFRDGFVAELLAKHGLDLANTSTAKKTLAKSAAERAAFFLDWNDSLMQYSGIDAVDHWMAAINWTPAITQIQGEGHKTIIGIVDGSFASDADLGNNIAWSGGGTSAVNGHGAGVASLIAGAHDGQGVMGIAPKVKIATYNPFDVDGNASWESVRQGIDELIFNAYVGGNETGYVSIINLSLGEKGWALAQGMADVLADPSISLYHHETIYVIAAGNDGISQTTDINWDYSKDASFILVGSVDPNGQISSFSNRPGTACLLNNGVCASGSELYNRFVVAPGSLILVSDGQGGVVRRSGTSFAAPLVSGAVSLLHDRWAWLVRHPEETAQIIFRSAQDLGAPGVDEVYGWGLLDVAASQSPLDFGAMTIYLNKGAAAPTQISAANLLAGGIPSNWETGGVYFTAFEKIGATYRDFLIPMSSLQRGKSTDAFGRGQLLMQDFISQRFANWILSGGTDKNGDGKNSITDIRSNQRELRGEWSFSIDAALPRFSQEGSLRPIHNAATLTDPSGTMSFTMGHGQGALALSGNGFGMISDYDPRNGGVNPVLGFASGEFFGSASYKIAPATRVAVGYSANREDWNDYNNLSPMQESIMRAMGPRDASAMTVSIEQQLTSSVTVNAQWTRLNEDNALLGAQTTVESLLGKGSVTNSMTVSASIDFGDGLTFDLSATGARTDTASDQALTNSDGVMSTAGQVAINKRGVLGNRDTLRVTAGQPLTVEKGELELNSRQVVDRTTGEVGIVSQTIGIETERRYMGEVAYATPITDSSEFGLFGRYVSAGGQDQAETFMVGANFGMRF